MVNYLTQIMDGSRINILAALVSFGLTFLVIELFRSKLPQDHGRQFAVNGALSKGKARGAGLLFVLCMALCAMAFTPFSVELLIYMLLLIASMLSGYLDDASDKPWNEYKKGLIDFIIAVVAGTTYLYFNGTSVHFLAWSFELPYMVYLVLAIILIWVAINVVNCTDGVDGLSGVMSLITMGTFLLAFREELGSFATVVVVVMASVGAYLWRNASPSSVMMGDAGSRALGFFVALLSMKSGHPFAFVLAALVFILDGGLGILKISLKRFLKIWILKNVRTPLHDHARKNCGWSDAQVVIRFALLQVLVSAVLLLLTGC